MRHHALEMLGLYGAVAILGGYFLVSFSIISSQGLLYQILNLTGAVGILLDSRYHRAVPSEILNGVWALVALLALSKIFLH